jgi:hypothetical protein
MEKETIVLLSEKVFLFVHNLGTDWTDYTKTERAGEYRHPINYYCTLVCTLYLFFSSNLKDNTCDYLLAGKIPCMKDTEQPALFKQQVKNMYKVHVTKTTLSYIHVSICKPELLSLSLYIRSLQPCFSLPHPPQ